MAAALCFVVLIGALAVFQLALAAGAPWGQLAWGGQHPGVLPTGYRIASGVSAAAYGFIAVLALDCSGLIDVFPGRFSEAGMWIVFGFLVLGVLMNAISRSRPERLVMTPVASVLALLALLVALAGSSA